MPILAGIGPLGVPELLIIAFIVLLIFGVGRLPEIGGALGKGIKEFRNNTVDDPAGASTTTVTDMSAPASDVAPAPDVASAPAAADGVFCSECGTKNTVSAKFCASCGKGLPASVS